MDEIIHHRVLPTDQNNTKNDAQPRQQPKKKKKTEFTILYGTASPPTSYGGYGGNAQETAK